MSSFLEGIESNSAPNVVPPEPPASLTTAEGYTAEAFPPSAKSGTSTSVFPKSSLMKEEDLFGEKPSEPSIEVCRVVCQSVCGKINYRVHFFLERALTDHAFQGKC